MTKKSRMGLTASTVIAHCGKIERLLTTKTKLSLNEIIRMREFFIMLEERCDAVLRSQGYKIDNQRQIRIPKDSERVGATST